MGEHDCAGLIRVGIDGAAAALCRRTHGGCWDVVVRDLVVANLN